MSSDSGRAATKQAEICDETKVNSLYNKKIINGSDGFKRER